MNEIKVKKPIGKKSLVFWVINIQLMAILILIIFFAKEFLASLGWPIIWAMVGNAAQYTGGQVWDAWHKSKYYQAALDGNKPDITTTGFLRVTEIEDGPKTWEALKDCNISPTGQVIPKEGQ